MHAYRFRILSDDSDDFVRDIEILAKQSFLDLHEYLVKLLEFGSNELASFSLCNSRWYKQCEITLIDMDFGKDEPDDDDDEPGVKKEKLKTYLMADSRLNEFMEDPHQRIIYEYDYMNPKLFYIELTKIVPADPNVVYPICIKSEGELPTKAKVAVGDDLLMDDDDLEGIGEVESIVAFDEELDEDFGSELAEGFEIEEREVGSYDNSSEESQRI
jgi:hypothetical protein